MLLLRYTSLEYLFETVEEVVLACGVGDEAVALLHLFKHLNFVFLQCFRNVHADVHDKVTNAVAVSLNTWQAFSTQTHNFARLCACLNLYLHFSIECWDFCCAAQYGCGQIQQQVVDKIIVVARKFVVLLYFNVHLDVAGDAVHLSGMALAFNGKYHSVCHASGNLHLYYLVAIDYALAATFLTLVLDDCALPVTSGAGALCLHAAEHGVHGAGYIAGTLTS